MKKMLNAFWKDESGAALVEYGVALLVVILVGTTALIGLADDTTLLFERAETATGAAVTASN